MSPSKTILCCEYRFSFHPSYTQLGNIANVNKLDKIKMYGSMKLVKVNNIS